MGINPILDLAVPYILVKLFKSSGYLLLSSIPSYHKHICNISNRQLPLIAEYS